MSMLSTIEQLDAKKFYGLVFRGNGCVITVLYLPFYLLKKWLEELEAEQAILRTNCFPGALASHIYDLPLPPQDRMAYIYLCEPASPHLKPA